MRLLAWAGGAVFVAALGYLIYFYTVVLASPEGDVALLGRNVAIDAALFTGFALHHSLLARLGAKAHIGRLMPLQFERSLYVWMASLLLLGVCLLWQPVPGLLYDAGGWWRLPFRALQACGAVITALAARAIDPLELAGIRQVTGRRSPAALKVVGPFLVVRHPIYLGWMLMVFTDPTMTANRLLFATISSAYLIIAIPWEEQSLVIAHGEAYRHYQRSVRWRVIPGVW